MTICPTLDRLSEPERDPAHRPSGGGTLQRTIAPVRIVLTALTILAAVTLPMAQEEEPEYPHGEYAGECSQCHGTEGWTPLVLDPEFRPKLHTFPLRQAHDLQDCRICHTSLDFTRADPACTSCHMDPHRQEFGSDCGLCHVPRTFIDRMRMEHGHHLTRFPLRGSHRALACEDCHPLVASGSLQFGKIPTECVACHLNDYLGATDPNHIVAGFSTGCDACHAPGIWQQGRFDHDAVFFPIYSGRHRNLWSSCSTCHIVAGDFSQFSCLGCHPHDDETNTTAKHGGIPGYDYNSDACYACHPRGEGD